MPDKSALPVITVRKSYFAKKPGTGSEKYATPVYLPNTTEVGIEKNFETSSFYAEGKAVCTNSVLGVIPVTLAVADLTESSECLLMGHRLSTTGGVIRSANDKAPEGAFGFYEEKADGTYDCTWLYSGRFVPGGRTATTSEGSPNYQAKTITANFISANLGAKLEEVTDYTVNLKTLTEVETFFSTVTLPVLPTQPA
ncbi:MAG: major tail protein [Filifactoraceae bacterium]